MPCAFLVLGEPNTMDILRQECFSLLTPPFLPEGPCHPLKSKLPAYSPPSSPHLIAPLLPSPQYTYSDLSYPKEALGLQRKQPDTATLMLPESTRYLFPLSVLFPSCLVHFGLK